ncbi:MAG: hypothetical protein U0414_21075 [Polyangiaceae bacterium]
MRFTSKAPRGAATALFAAAFCAASVACRDVEIVDGTGGGSTSTTKGSSVATTGVTTSTGGTTICGGKQGVPCAADEYCDYADGSCGAADGTGICVSKPLGCTADCPGVCACDGSFFCNACGAAEQGLDVSSSSACLPDNAEYSAKLWLGGLDHLVIRKADFQRDVCFEVFLDAPQMIQDPYFITAPQQFAASNAIAILGATNCYQDVAPDPPIVQAEAGKGAVDWKTEPMMYYPCEISLIDIELTFSGSSSWVMPIETLKATGVKVEGGCL